jgi:steroid 5-alpha reductase family enzyme
MDQGMSASLATMLPINTIVVAGLMLLVWLASIPLKNVAIVDIAWGLGFVLVAVTSTLISDVDSINRWLLPLLVGIWGMRLAGYLAWRNLGKSEDKRYAIMRQLRGPSFRWSSLWVVFIPQALLILVISLPVQLGIRHASGELHWLHFIGIAAWLTGMFFETIGDYQLARFLADPASKAQVMNRGLWRYTRHPNYFGDFLVWWGFYLVAMSGTWPTFWWTAIGPIVMSILLMRVSGVPMLEATLKSTRPGYADYVYQTNSFFPWWPKSQ